MVHGRLNKADNDTPGSSSATTSGLEDRINHSKAAELSSGSRGRLGAFADSLDVSNL